MRRHALPQLGAPRPARAHLTLVPGRDVTVLAVAGELDLATMPALQASLDAAVGAGGDVVLDLRGVTFVDLATLGTLVRGCDRIERAGRRLVVLPSAEPVVARLARFAGDRRIAGPEELLAA